MDIFGITIVKTIRIKKLQATLNEALDLQSAEIERLRDIERKYKVLTDRDDKGRFVKKEQ